eukprot:Platyproteum_vivax@DN3759_c0_g1_i1.p1
MSIAISTEEAAKNFCNIMRENSTQRNLEGSAFKTDMSEIEDDSKDCEMTMDSSSAQANISLSTVQTLENASLDRGSGDMIAGSGLSKKNTAWTHSSSQIVESVHTSQKSPHTDLTKDNKTLAIEKSDSRDSKSTKKSPKRETNLKTERLDRRKVPNKLEKEKSDVKVDGKKPAKTPRTYRSPRVEEKEKKETGRDSRDRKIEKTKVTKLLLSKVTDGMETERDSKRDKKMQRQDTTERGEEDNNHHLHFEHDFGDIRLPD